MKTSLVLTVIGPDRPGLVDALSSTIVAHGGGWLSSRMARLAGHFAGIVEVEVEVEAADDLQRALTDLAGAGLRVEVTPTAAEVEERLGQPLRIEIVGLDRPGIVKAIARTLAAHGANVASLESERRRAPMTGDPMFEAHVLAQVPTEVSVDTLRLALEALAGDLVVELTVTT